ncbi:MAG: hypothetical protein PHF51_00565 [Candidatus ainarchaeum sp.]|nr:hypothetical protein [Candidatus ainarchaeum sp.]
MAKVKQRGSQLDAAKRAVEETIDAKARTLSDARKELPALLDAYASSLERNGKQADDLPVAVRTLDWFGPEAAVRV